MTATSIDTPETAQQDTRRPLSRLMQFRLSTLLVLMALAAAVLTIWLQRLEIQRADEVLAAHGLARHDRELDADQFRVRVNDVTMEHRDLFAKQIVVETIGGADMTVTDLGGNLSRTNFSTSGQRDGELTRAHVALVFDLVKRGDQPPVLRELTEVRSPTGSSVGGPSLYTLRPGQELQDVVELRIQPGVYERGEAVPIYDLNGSTFYLLVK